MDCIGNQNIRDEMEMYKINKTIIDCRNRWREHEEMKLDFRFPKQIVYRPTRQKMCKETNKLKKDD